MKKLCYLLLLFCISCTKTGPDTLFEYVDPLEKILSESTLFLPAVAHADVVKGENATYQFAFRSNCDVQNLRVKLTPFVNQEDGSHLPGSASVSFVGNVHVGRAQMTPAKDLLVSPSGFYPDPLLDDEAIGLKANTTQAIWITVPVNSGYPSGVYHAEVTVEGETGKGKVYRKENLQLKIYSTVVDRQTLLVTNWYQPGFSFVDGEDVPQFSERWWELMGQLADYMKAYRQNMVLISPLMLAEYTFSDGVVETIDFNRFDEMVRFFRDKGVLERIAGGHIGGRFGGWESLFGYYVPVETVPGGDVTFRMFDCKSTQARTFYKKFFAELMEHLEDKGWKDIYIQHIADEPIKSNADSYIAISSYIKSLCPDLKLVDACHTKDLDNRIDVWIPQLNYLHRDFDFYQSQQQKGKEVWYYTCVWPQGDYANRFIQQPLLKTRLLHWINYKYDINGYLHWGFNFWRGENPLMETAAIQPDGLVLPAGDAWVIYPYKGRLIPSIRLEAMRDGIIDYELLRMLEEYDVERARELTNKLIYDFNKYDMDIVHFRAIRKQLLEALETHK